MQLVDVHARLRREHRWQARRVREQIEHRDALANAAREFRDHLRDLGRQHQLAALDRAKRENVRDRLGRREDTEYRIHAERLRSGAALVADRGLEADLAAARDLEHRAEIALARDVVANHGLHVLQEIRPPGHRCFRHISPLHAQADAAMPPSTCSTAPLMNSASRLNRNATALSLSCSCPSRRNGIVFARRAYSSGELRPIAPGVGTEPGATALTRILRGPSSAANVRVSEVTALLMALYTSVLG